MTKQMLESEHTMTLAAAIEAEAQAQAICMMHPDFRAAYDAWRRKKDHALAQRVHRRVGRGTTPRAALPGRAPARSRVSLADVTRRSSRDEALRRRRARSATLVSPELGLFAHLRESLPRGACGVECARSPRA